MNVPNVSLTYLTISFLSIGFGYLFIHNYFYIVKVVGFSMLPYLKNGDRVLVMRHYPPRWIRRGQVALLDAWPELKTSNQGYLIKRVVGLAGDNLSIYMVNLRIPC